MKAMLVRTYETVLGRAAGAIGNTGVHPNVLTAVSLIPAAAAGIAAAGGAYIPAALLLGLSGIFDLLDGAVARRTGKVSRFGALFDSVIDRISDAAVPLGLLVYFAPSGAAPIPAALIVAGFLVSYVRARAEGLGFDLPRLWMRREERMGIVLVALVLGGIAPSPHLLLSILGALTVASLVAAAQALWVAARQENAAADDLLWHSADEKV